MADVPGRHEPETGEINCPNVMNALRKLKYEGVIGFVLFPSNVSKKVAEELISL